MVKICGGIVLFNPDVDRLEKNIKSVRSQVQELILIDNGSKNIEEFSFLINKYNCKIIYNYENKGIAYALNQLLTISNSNNYEWILTLDQDSIVSSSIISHFVENIQENIAIICPKISSSVSKEETNNLSNELIDKCITSGSFTNIKKAILVGGFDEKMFIDLVDFEFCFRIKQFEYEILRDNREILNHQYGNEEKIEILYYLGEKIKSDKIKQFAIKKNYNEIRNYYYLRNSLYFIKKHKKNINNLVYLKKLLNFIIHMFLIEDNKFKNLITLYRAIKDYKAMKDEDYK